jgi:hypothetical protein
MVANAVRRRRRLLSRVDASCRRGQDFAERDLNPGDVLGREGLQIRANEASE